MDTQTHQRIDDLRAKSKAGTITEDEFVELLRADEGEEESFARHMFRTSYAAKHQAPDTEGRTTLI